MPHFPALGSGGRGLMADSVFVLSPVDDVECDFISGRLGTLFARLGDDSITLPSITGFGGFGRSGGFVDF